MTPNDHGDTPSGGEADLPGPEGDDLVEADLPGLEPDRPAEPAESAEDSGERIDRAVEEWKDELEAAGQAERRALTELDRWFEDFGGNSMLEEIVHGFLHLDEYEGIDPQARFEIEELADYLYDRWDEGSFLEYQGEVLGHRFVGNPKEELRRLWEATFPADLPAVPDEESVIPELGSIVVDTPEGPSPKESALPGTEPADLPGLESDQAEEPAEAEFLGSHIPPGLTQRFGQVAEVTISALDSSSKEPAYMTIKLDPERIRYMPGDGSQVQAKTGTVTKKWLSSNFKVEIGDLPCTQVAAVDEITWEQHVVKDEVGMNFPAGRHPAVEVSNMKLTISMEDIGEWEKWHRDFIIDGKSSDGEELSGAIRFLGPDMREELARIDLLHIGLTSLETPAADASEKEVGHFTVELSVIPELAPTPYGSYGPQPGDEPDSAGPTFSIPWIYVVGGVGVLGLVLAVGFFVFGGSESTDPDAAPSAEVAAPEEAASAGAIVEPVAVEDEAEDEPVVEDEPEAAVALPDPSAEPFPSLWLFTATKIGDTTRIPDSMDTGAPGIQLELYVIVTETCTDDACTYTSVVEPLDRFAPLIDPIPEATWKIEEEEWTLDAMWKTGPDCVADHHFTYIFTVTETDLIDGRTVPAAFTGTWTQDAGSECNGGWEHVAEWSVVGTTATG